MIQAVIFNLDGVLVTTDACHFQAWRQMAEEHGIPFDEALYARIRGLSRLDGMGVILEKSRRPYTEGEKLALAMRKNDLYLALVARMTEESLLPGAIDAVAGVRRMGFHTAVGSSSQNARLILRKLQIGDLFDAVVDGNQVINLKPDPEVFLLAARKMNMRPDRCLVVEDAYTGVEAAHRAKMLCLAVGDAAADPAADFRAENLSAIDLPAFLRELNASHPAEAAAVSV